MEQQANDLTKRAALASLPWAAGLTMLLVATGLIPCCGLIVFPASVFGIAYYLTPQLGVYPMPETKNALALNIGVGVGLTAMGSLLVATIVGQLLGLLLTSVFGLVGRDWTSLVFGLSFSLVITLVYAAVAIVGGAAVGILCAYLGGLTGLARVRPAQ